MILDLKTELILDNSSRERQLKAQLELSAQLSTALSEFDPSNALYTVFLQSCWEGEQAVVRDHAGDLAQAISLAETEFKRVNRRGDVQARYDVKVRVANQALQVPRAYWWNYAEIAKK